MAIAGVAASRDQWTHQSRKPGVRISASAFGPGWMTPLVGTQAEADLLAKVRVGNPFPFGSGDRERERERESKV